MNGDSEPTFVNAPKKGHASPSSGGNRAVIYSRVSSKDQVDNFSLTTQQKACRDYCAKHGFTVDKVFIEEGESAKTANRTEFQKALAYLNNGRNGTPSLIHDPERSSLVRQAFELYATGIHTKLCLTSRSTFSSTRRGCG